MRQNAVATDAESASNLHRVLSQDRTTSERERERERGREGERESISKSYTFCFTPPCAAVSPDTFKTFYEAWKVVSYNVLLQYIQVHTCTHAYMALDIGVA